MSVLARAGDVEAQDPEADGHQAGAGEILAILVQAQHENNSRDDPTVAKEASAPGGDRNHGLRKLSSLSDSGFEELTGFFVHEVDVAALHATGE